jgi:hypothetical protein
MNCGAILFRFIPLVTLLGALFACQQEPAPELSEAVDSSITPTLEQTQKPPTATVMQSSPTKSTGTSTPTSNSMPLETPTSTPEGLETPAFSMLDYTDDSTKMPTTPATKPPLPTSTTTPLPLDQSDEVTEPTDAPKESPEVDALAIIHWQDLELPDNFQAIYPESFGIGKGATARELVDSNGELFTVPIENSFVFMDDEETTFIFGYTFILDDEQYRQAFIADQIDGQSLASQFPSATLIDVPGIGDASGGFSALLSEEERIDSAQFLIGDVAATVYIRYPEGQSAPLDVVQLAQVYADSLVDPEPRCHLESITPIEDPVWPAYAFVATGFFPREQRIVRLSGFVKKGEETLTADMTLAGLTGETSDQEGKVVGEIKFGPYEEEGLVPILQELMLEVIGGFSGCEASETVTWAPQQTDQTANLSGEVLVEPAAPVTQPADSETEGFRTHALPGWGSLDIPEDWHILYSPTPGLLLISSKDAGSFEETSDEDALLQISQLDNRGWLPIDIISNDYLPTLGYEIELVSEPQALTIHGQEAATTTYHGYEDFMEQMTIYQSQDGSRTAYLLSMIGEEKWPEYEKIFEQIRDSVNISPLTAGPELSPVEELPEDYALFVDDEQGYQFGYPSAWSGIENDSAVVFSPTEAGLPAELEHKFGSLYIYPPSTYIVGDEMPGEGYTADGQVTALWDWAGTMAIQDAMMTSELSHKRVGETDYAAAYFVATDESRDNQPIYGFMGVVTDGEKVVKMISWFHDPQEYQEVWLRVFNSIQLIE